MALEGEINRWSGFARELRVEERKAFDAIMDACRSYASAVAKHKEWLSNDKTGLQVLAIGNSLNY